MDLRLDWRGFCSANQYFFGEAMSKFDYCYVFRCYFNIMKTLWLGLVFLCILLTPPVASSMTSLGDGELATVNGGMGVSIAIPTGTVQTTIGSVVLWESYPDVNLHDTGLGFDVPFKNSIELKNIVWDDGSGGGYSVATPAGDPVTFDIGTYVNGRTYLNIHDSTNVSPRTFTSELVFCGQPLGSLKVSDIVRTENNVMIGAHGGVDFEYREKIDIGYAQFTTPANALTFTGIHLSETASGSLEGDPSTWTYSGPFKIGDIAGGNPAQVDFGTDASGVTSIRLKLPMEGNIRVENVTFGGSNFGAMALDGLNVHHLAVQFHP
jgi:hypothetical protein